MILISQKSEGSGAVVEWGGGEESLISAPDTSAAIINHLGILTFIGAKVWCGIVPDLRRRKETKKRRKG